MAQRTLQQPLVQQRLVAQRLVQQRTVQQRLVQERLVQQRLVAQRTLLRTPPIPACLPPREEPLPRTDCPARLPSRRSAAPGGSSPHTVGMAESDDRTRRRPPPSPQAAQPISSSRNQEACRSQEAWSRAQRTRLRPAGHLSGLRVRSLAFSTGQLARELGPVGPEDHTKESGEIVILLCTSARDEAK